MQSLRILVTSAVFSVVGAIGVHAASITLFSDESAFDAAVAGAITEDFSTIVSPGANQSPTVYDFGAFEIDKQYSDGGSFMSGSLAGAWKGKPSSTLGDILEFDNNLSAWGGTFNLALGGIGSGLVFKTFFEGSIVDMVIGSASSSGFFGFTSDIAFDTVKIFTNGGGSEKYLMYDMKYAQISPVPLPAGMVLLGSGLVLIGGLSRRKKNK